MGVFNGQVVTDLDYAEDSRAETDMNVVLDDQGGLIEVQGTAEDGSFSPEELMKMLNYAQSGIDDIVKLQHQHINGD